MSPGFEGLRALSGRMVLREVGRHLKAVTAPNSTQQVVLRSNLSYWPLTSRVIHGDKNPN